MSIDLNQALEYAVPPSNTACVISSLVVSMDIPINVALAFGSLCGDLSPIRYGR